MTTEGIYVVKADGNRELFNVEKLEHSLKRAGATTDTASKIVEHIKTHLTDDITTHEIYKHSFELLEKDQKPIALKYSLKKAISDLGPSGFPFEDFVAEIFKYRGYEAVTGQIVKGFCVEHEIDVVAWKNKELIMVEAKFHNEPGIKSDLKIALYVKARFDDLSKMTFKYGGERNMTEGWLVTNTKFTTTAIEYGSCQGGLKMIGWNYPPIGNLHDMILESKLHPLTCLVNLNGREKKELLDKGVVLCKSIIENREILSDIGLNEDRVRLVLEEIAML